MNGLSLGFVEDFRSADCAILALRLIMEKQKAGLSYSDILDYPGFVGLFSPTFITGKTRFQMIVKLKNTVRDLRDTSSAIPTELVDVQLFFRERKRRRRISMSKKTMEEVILATTNTSTKDILQQEDQRILSELRIDLMEKSV